MRKIAFSHWDNRIAPVFDTSCQIRLVGEDNRRIVLEREELLVEGLPAARALRLAELGVDVLVCGAISRVLQETVAGWGIRVVPFVAGDLEEIIRAWVGGAFDCLAFAMPGCYGKNRRRLGGGRRGRSQQPHPGEGPGWGRQVRGWGGKGLRSPAAVRAGGWVCPRCGQWTPPEPGAPWRARYCPCCGAVMTAR
ncbi:MAG: NifB/NifX family molybdenum-iron cluster-binding protein [Pseudomonadota bacterium]|nr:NifB/NifX family molybdenum-iron cluster-binding protein [Pseudomonadota bacterium]